MRLRPNYAETLNNLGTVLQETGKLTEAENCLREALRLKPDFAKAHNNLGIVLGLEKKPAEAEHAYREAIRLIPNFAEAHYNLAHILHLQGKLDEAMASTEQSLQFKPDYPEARSHLGILALLNGDFDKGWPAYDGAGRPSRWPRISATFLSLSGKALANAAARSSFTRSKASATPSSSFASPRSSRNAAARCWWNVPANCGASCQPVPASIAFCPSANRPPASTSMPR